MSVPRCEVIGDCTLWLGDALEVLPYIGAVDAIITDPPFTMAGGISNGMTSCVDTQYFQYWFTDIATGLIASCKPHAAMALWCDWRSIAIFDAAFNSASKEYALWRISQVIIHDREMIGMGQPFRNQCDWIAIARGPKTDFQGRIPATTPNIFREYSYYGKHEFHPAEKTVAAITRFVLWLSDAHQMVLDPFAGSASTAIACIKTGRKFVGIEVKQRYFDLACRRIDAAYKQPDLFLPRAASSPPAQPALFSVQTAMHTGRPTCSSTP